MKLYHGNCNRISKLYREQLRSDKDFGAGIYLTEDKRVALKKACYKEAPVLRTYELDLCDLKVKELVLDEEWLLYIMKNRTGNKEGHFVFDDKAYDVVIGVAVDDKIFTVVEMYGDGLLSAKDVIKVVEKIGYSRQVVLKTVKAAAKLKCLGIRVFFEEEKKELRREFEAEAREGHKRMQEILREINGRNKSDLSKCSKTT